MESTAGQAAKYTAHTAMNIVTSQVFQHLTIQFLTARQVAEKGWYTPHFICPQNTKFVSQLSYRQTNVPINYTVLLSSPLQNSGRYVMNLNDRDSRISVQSTNVDNKTHHSPAAVCFLRILVPLLRSWMAVWCFEWTCDGFGTGPPIPTDRTHVLTGRSVMLPELQLNNRVKKHRHQYHLLIIQKLLSWIGWWLLLRLFKCSLQWEMPPTKTTSVLTTFDKLLILLGSKYCNDGTLSLPVHCQLCLAKVAPRHLTKTW